MDESKAARRGEGGMSSPPPHDLMEHLEPRTHLATVTWDGGITGLGTSWHEAVNWEDDAIPGPGDDVVIDVGGGVEYSAGALELRSLTSSRPLFILGGELGVTGGGGGGWGALLTSQVTLDGGALSGGPWVLAGPGLVSTDDPDNSLVGATIVGDISMALTGAFIRVTGNLFVDGLVAMHGDGAAISFDGGTPMWSGNTDVLFSGFTGYRSISADAGAVLTLGAQVSFTGERGRLMSGLISGTGSIVNLGTIWANTFFGTIDVLPGTFVNLGTLRATGNGILSIDAGNWTNSGIVSINDGTVHLGGTLDITGGIGVFSRNGGDVFIVGTIINTSSTLTLGAATGTWRLRGGEILGGTITFAAGATLDDFPSASGRLAQVVVNGDLAWSNSNFTGEFDGVTINGNFDFGNFSSLYIRGGLTLNGILTVTGANTLIQFDTAAQSIMGSAVIHLRNEEAYLWAVEPLTIPAGLVMSGYGRVFGLVTNFGSLHADTPAKTLLIGHGIFQNNGTVSAAAGAKLWIGESIASQATFVNAGQFTVADAASVTVGPNSFSGPITFTNIGSMEVSDGGTVTFGTQSVFNPITVLNSGQIDVSTGGAMVIGSSSATIPVVFTSTGIARALSGGSISIRTPATSTQLGDLRAAGGSVTLASVVNNTGATLTVSASTGSWIISGGAILGGTVAFQGSGASLLFDSSVNNALDGVTIHGNLALGQAGARLMIRNGLTLVGTITISGENATLWFNGGTQSVQGTGSIVLAGSTGLQTISADADATVTLGAGITVSGTSGAGRVRSGQVVGGAGAIINQGLIAGAVLVDTSSFTNAGTVEARIGLTLTVQGVVTNFASGSLTGGTWRIGAASQLTFVPGLITINRAVVILDGPGSTCVAIAGLAVNAGTLTLAGGRDLTLDGSLVNTGTIDIEPGSDLAVAGAFVQSAAGTLKLGLSSESAPTVSAGTASISGTLAVTWLAGYVPPVGTTVPFLNMLGGRGRFTTFAPQSLGFNHAQSLSYSPTSVSLVIARVLADRR